MSNIRALSLNEIALVSGGNGSGNYEGAGSRNTSSKSGNSKGNNGSIYKGVDSCGAGIIGGLIAGSLGGSGYDRWGNWWSYSWPVHKR